MVTICEQCGDKGWSETLIYCEQCQIAAVHRYCLYVLPPTFEEDVIWSCVDCESEVAKPPTVVDLYSPDSRKCGSENSKIVQPTQSGLKSKEKNDVNHVKNKQKRRDPRGSLAISEVCQCENNPCHHLDVHCNQNHQKDQKFRKWTELHGNKSDEEAESVKTKTSLIAGGDCKRKPEYNCALHCSEGDKKNEKHGRPSGLHGSNSLDVTESVKTKTSLVVTSDPASIPKHGCYDNMQPIGEVSGSENDKGINKSRRRKVLVIDSSDEEIESVEPKTSIPAASNSLSIPKDNSTDGAESIIEIRCKQNDEIAQRLRRHRGLERRSSNEEAESAELENSLVVATVPSANPNRCLYVPAQPIFKPVWNGSLSLGDENYGTIGGLGAHLSTLACSRVFEAAKQLPELLCLELLPRSDVWPASFLKWGPSDNNIGLYLFPTNQRGEKVYDSLVNDMISNDLAMRTVVKNTELLLFTSKMLPFQFWRFQAKFYLWGVFKGRKQASATEACHFVQTISLVSQSPVSPLSNSASNVSGSVYSSNSHTVV